MSGDLVIIRPAPGAGQTARAARDIGFKPIVHSMFEAKPLRWEPPDPALYDALIVSSANALRLGGPALAALQKLPVHAVGQATASTARALGFTIATVGESGVEALARSLTQATPQRFLRLAGRQHVELVEPGMLIDTVLVYAVDPVPLPAPLKQRLAQGDVTVALHSPRAARHFAVECDRLGLDRQGIALAALSSNIADAAGGDWCHIAIADAPDDARLLSAAAQRARP